MYRRSALARPRAWARYCLPVAPRANASHCRIPGFQGQATDISIHAEEILALKHRLNEIMAKHTGQDVETIERDLERDNFMSAADAVDYGLIDTVLEQRNEMAGTESD